MSTLIETVEFVPCCRCPLLLLMVCLGVWRNLDDEGGQR